MTELRLGEEAGEEAAMGAAGGATGEVGAATGAEAVVVMGVTGVPQEAVGDCPLQLLYR